MNEERIWILLARKLAGEASANDVQELENLLGENPALASQLEAIEHFWNSQPIPGEEAIGIKLQWLLKEIKNMK